MGRFIFKFEALLKHRRHVEDQRQRELAQHMRARMILEDQLRGMQQTIRSSKQELGSALVGRIDLDRIGQFARYTGHTRVRGQQIVVKVAELEKQIEVARQSLLEATRQRKALELLYDRHREQWLAEQQRRETIELDEIANQRFAQAVLMEGGR